MERGLLSESGSRLGAAHARRKACSSLLGWRAGGFHSAALAAPRAFASNACSSFNDGGLVVVKVWLLLQRRS
eukprot:4355897-Pyramimonas_sp.AAC.1